MFIRMGWTAFWSLFVLAGCAHASSFAPLKNFESTWQILATSPQKLVVSTSKKEILLVPWDNLQSALRLNDSSEHLSHMQFSPDGKFLMAAYSPSKRLSEIKIYDVLNGKVLQKSPKLERLQTGFWLNSCRYAAVTAPLENGGRLQIFKRPTATGDSQCSKTFQTSEKLPVNKMPLALWKDSSFNVWAYYENCSRELLSWLGKGSFFDFQMGPYPYVWYREYSTPDLVFRADRSVKKIQPLTGSKLFVADPNEPRIYSLHKGKVYVMSLNSKFKVEEVLLQRLPDGFQARALWLDSPRKRLILQSQVGSYHMLPL
jgi:hypothetical protein